MRLAEDGSHTTFYALAGRRLSRDEFLAAKQRWVADFLARTGLDKVPSAAEFAAKRAQYAQLRNVNAFDDIAAANAATYEAEHDLLVHEEPLDEDFAHSYEAVDDPYIPSLALFQYQVDREADRGSCRLNPRWPAAKNARVHATTLRVEAQRRHRAAVEAALGPDDDPVEPTRILRFRSLRDHLRHLRGNHDALWHGTIPEDDVDPSAVSLG